MNILSSARSLTGLGLTLSFAGAMTGCPSTPTGDLVVSLQAEDTIAEGLAAGTGDEQITDGWAITYTKFIVALGHVHVQQAGGAVNEVEMDTLADLRSVSSAGRPVQTLTALPTGRYTFEYDTPIASADMTRDASVSAADQARMVAEGCTYLIQGTATREARSIAFDFCLAAETVLECSAMEGAEGIVINSGSNSAAMTLHGDHLWFNGFPDGDEGVVLRRAGWLALVDDRTGMDGMLTNADLTATPVTVLDPTLYSLTGAPSVDGMPITNLLQYARAQVTTQGHLNGEGECLANGMGHDHGA
jgi:hypothetical protein